MTSSKSRVIQVITLVSFESYYVVPYSCKVSLAFLNCFRISDMLFKGCVCYIFANLFCMSKGEYLKIKGKCFFFYYQSSFRSWDNQILTFQVFRCHEVIKCSSIKHKSILLNNLRSKHILVMKFGQFMYITKEKFLSKDSIKNVAWKIVSDPF